MDVTLKIHRTLDDCLDLVSEVDAYATQAIAEFRDGPLPKGTGDRLLRRALDSREGVILTSHAKGDDEIRLGLCVTVPLFDPLVGDAMPCIVVLHTHPDYRHRGLARVMVDALRGELIERGFGLVAARAGHNDDALISMGERWGFVRSHEVMVLEEQ